jgi:ABC-type sugar transport system permease subunit
VVTVLLVDLGGGPVGQTVALVLAQEPEPTPDEGPEFGKASPIALVVIILLGIATLFLVRSMTKHLRRVPASFDKPDVPTEGEPPPER